MKNRKILTAALIFCFALSFSSVTYAQDEPKAIQEDMSDAPKVFLDCRRCDRDYIKTEIPFVTYVRDRKDADVHILITNQGTGSGGQEYTMTFIGLKDYEGLNNTLKYSSYRDDTNDDVRKAMAHVLKAGLIPYVARTPILNQIKFDYLKRTKPVVVEDRWDYWVFYISLRGQLSGQKVYNNSEISGNVSASRITPKSKLRLGLSGEFRERIFKFDDETITSPSDEQNLSGLWVKTLSDHWSLGGWFGASSDTFSNTQFRYYLAPALEYNIFPYADVHTSTTPCSL